MKTNRKSARIAGVLFLTAMVSSLMGGGIIESVLNTPDFLINVMANTILVSAGVFLELINGIAVIGIAFMLYPILKDHNQSVSLGYVGIRIIESVFCFSAAILPLFISAISLENSMAGAADTASFQVMGRAIIATRSHLAEIWIPLFFSLSALLLYSMLYQARSVPRFISIWGFLGAALILASAFIESGLAVGMVMALPIILNEIFLGIWLIVKGFRPLNK